MTRLWSPASISSSEPPLYCIFQIKEQAISIWQTSKMTWITCRPQTLNITNNY
jgi:hypothetical protein